jgi:ketosteroid isomerase-like protein
MDLPRTLAKFAAAVEAGDGDALAGLFTADGVYDDYFFGPSEPGRAGIRAMLAHFYDGGEAFKWEFFDVVAQGDIGYASYMFSYTSKLAEAKGARVVFDGISRLELQGGLIRRYSEVFDRGTALAQQDFSPERLKKVALRYAGRLKGRPQAKAHLESRRR